MLIWFSLNPFNKKLYGSVGIYLILFYTWFYNPYKFFVILLDKNYFTTLWYFVFVLNDNDFNVYIFLSLVIAYLYKHNFIKYLNIFFVYWILLLYNTSTLYYLTDTPELENFTLYNGLVMIHPILIYCFYLSFFYVLEKKIKIKIKIKNNFLFGLCTLMLGSWWAQQEINWGGWWNWDIVEIVLWILLLKSILYNHFWVKTHTYLILNYLLSNLYTYIFVFFVFIRLDIIDSVHVFNSFDMLDLNFWFFEQLINLYLFYIIILVSKILKFNNLRDFKPNKITIICCLLNFLCLYYIIIYTWFIFSAINFDTDISEFVVYLKNGQNIFILFLLFLSIKKTQWSFFLNWYTLWQNFFLFYYLFLLRFFLKFKLHKNIHLSFLFFIYLLYYFYYFDDLKAYEENLNIKNYIEFFDSIDFFFISIFPLNPNNFYQLFNTDPYLEVGFIELPFFIMYSDLINFFLITIYEEDFFIWLNSYILILLCIGVFIIIYNSRDKNRFFCKTIYI